MKKILLSVAVIAFAIGCKCNKTDAAKNTVKVDLESKSGSTVSGTATFAEHNGRVTLDVKLFGLKPGVHAIHIHEKADCSSADGSSAGGHWNPTFKKHGKWGEGEYHKGDIGNVTADPSGNAKLSMTTEEWCIGCGDQTKDILGKGLIVHEKADDFTTQPTGNAGGRQACAGIIK